MKLSSILLVGAFFVGSSSAYRISLYSEDNYQGIQGTFVTSGTHNANFTVKSWIWESTNDGCCIVFCKGGAVRSPGFAK